MPHVIVKLASGRSEQTKSRLARAITDALITTLDVDADAISVAIEDIDAEAWAHAVYEPDIRDARDRLYKKPGYTL